MCESCEARWDQESFSERKPNRDSLPTGEEKWLLGRREFLTASSLAGTAAVLGQSGWAEGASSEEEKPVLAPKEKKPARIWTVFLYPPEEVVLAGKMEDTWANEKWFTWPGGQFQYAEQQKKFTAQIEQMGKQLGVEITVRPEPIWQKAKLEEFIPQAKGAELDAVLVVNFYNTLSGAAYRLATAATPGVSKPLPGCIGSAGREMCKEAFSSGDVTFQRREGLARC